MSPRRGLHTQLKQPGTPYHSFPNPNPIKTPLEVSELPPGTTIEQVLEDGWNNPIPGGSVDPISHGFFGDPGYGVYAQGWTRLELRVSSHGVHGWPVP